MEKANNSIRKRHQESQHWMEKWGTKRSGKEVKKKT